MRGARLLLLVSLASASAAGVSSRQAHAAGDDVAAAQLLFDEGRRRMGQGDYANACPKLAESQRLSPAVGTEFNLAVCWEHVGKLASSWAAFLDVADLTHRRGEGEREQAARQRAEALAPRLGKLSVEVPATRRVADLEVRRDGELVRDALWGIAVPVDAGDHRVEARATGRRPWSAVVHTQDGQTATVTLDLVECGEVSQALFSDLAAVIRVQIVEFSPRMGHAADFDDAAIEECFVSGVVVADKLAGPVA